VGAEALPNPHLKESDVSSDEIPRDTPVFIVSTGRAGSQMLARVLSEAPGVLALHEPRPHLVTEGYLRWTGKMSDEEAEDAVRDKRLDLVGQVERNGLIYVESSHYCSHFIPELARVFDARFIFLHREPRGFTRSGLSRDWYEELSRRQRLEMMARRKWRVAVGHVWHDHRLEPPPELESRMERIAWLWSEINRTILEGLEAVEPERKLEIRLDSVGPARFAEVLEFVGAEPEPAVLERMTAVAARKPNKTKTRPEELDPWDEDAFRRVTAPMAERLGYPV
jgi:hypothetical protein